MYHEKIAKTFKAQYLDLHSPNLALNKLYEQCGENW